MLYTIKLSLVVKKHTDMVQNLAGRQPVKVIYIGFPIIRMYHNKTIFITPVKI